MSGNKAKIQVLQALRARLELDSGLGVGFMEAGFSQHELESCVADILAAPEKPLRQDTATRESAPVETSRRTAFTSSKSLENPLPAASPERSAASLSVVPFSPSDDNAEKRELLTPLFQESLVCRDCVLAEKRNTVVWGEGSLDARVMFIGEGPGRDEDIEGRPFVGKSGRLLTDIIEKGMKVPRSGVYITNVVKCRPPGNREPRPEETAACARYLDRQLEVIKPRVIVAVGSVAGCALLGLPPRTPGLRGKWHQCRGIPMRVIYHPSYLLRQRRTANDRTKADLDTWNDIKEVMAKLGE